VNRNRYTTFLLVALDLIASVGVFNLVNHYRGMGGGFVLLPLVGPVGCLLFAIYLIDGYRARTDMLRLDYASVHIIAVLFAMMITLLTTFAFVPAGYELQSSRIVIGASFILLIPVTLGYRRMIYMRVVAPYGGVRSIVFVGDASSGAAFVEECRSMAMRQPVILAAVDPGPPESGKVALRRFADVLDAIQPDGNKTAEAIVVRESSRDIPPQLARRLVELYFSGVPTYTLEIFHRMYWRKIPIHGLNPTWLFQEGFQIARDPVFERLKRASDLALAAAGLLLSAPLIFLASLAIWLEDRGPAFFVQARVGKNHVRFKLMKLRTMRPGSEAAGDPYTRAGDRRVTRVGRLLRSTRMDELPQLWNVLKGEMSMIGPRAEWDRLAGEYERQIPCYYFRHLVKPGITGWAQVNYTYGSSLDDTVRKLEYDLYYIRNFSFLLDAAIVLKTIQIMAFGKGR
jgi:exopolysaccharide biosynthesis polyprenyl glycosylphosphotransferase